MRRYVAMCDRCGNELPVSDKGAQIVLCPKGVDRYDAKAIYLDLCDICLNTLAVDMHVEDRIK